MTARKGDVQKALNAEESGTKWQACSRRAWCLLLLVWVDVGRRCAWVTDVARVWRVRQRRRAPSAEEGGGGGQKGGDRASEQGGDLGVTFREGRRLEGLGAHPPSGQRG